MAKYQTGDQALESMSGGSGGINFREVLVDLKPDPQMGKTIKKLRLIGLPIEYYEAQARKRSIDDPSKTVACPFPDSELNKSFTRICNDDPEKDIWTQMGYIKIKRYAINCIDRDNNKVKILARGKSIFKEFYRSEKDNQEENVELIANNEEPLWTLVGGEEAPDVKIIATYNEKSLGNVEYDVRFSPKVNKLTSEELAKLRQIGEPTPEELAQIRKENPSLEGCPDWFFWGFNLEQIFKPTTLKTGTEYIPEKSTAPEEMEINLSKTDEEEVSVPKEKVSKLKKTAKVDTDEEEASVDENEGEEETVDLDDEDVQW